MATDFTQESVLGFLRCNGEKVKNADLLHHFKYYLKEDEDRVQNRELFKKFVNAVAVVNREDGVSYVVLRKKFRVPGRDAGSGQCHIPKHQEEKPESSRARHRERSPRRTATSRSRERRRAPTGGETTSNPKTTTHRPPQAPPIATNSRPTNVLPAAGIVSPNKNNVETVNFEKTVKMPPQQQTWEMSPPSLIITESPVSRTLKPSPTPVFSPPESKRSSGSGQSFEQTWDKEPAETAGQQVHNSIGNLVQSREADGCSSAAFSSLPDDSSHSDLTRFSLADLTQSSEMLDQSPGGGGCRDGMMLATAAWPLHSSLGLTPGISSSSPCIADVAPSQSHPPLSKAAQPMMSASSDCLATPVRQPSHYLRGETAPRRALAEVNTPFQRRSLPLDPSYSGDDASSVASYPELYPTPLTSTHGCLAGSDCEWPFPLTQSQASWSSDDNLSQQQRVLEGAPSSSERVKETLQRAQEAQLLSLMHRPVRTVVPSPHHHHHHRSTGYLEQEMPSDRAHTPSPPPGSTVPGHLLRVPTQRGSQRFRGRISRSLGAGLDQPFLEDTEAARQHRLMLLSSSLSINYPLSGAALQRTPSSRDVSLSGASSTASLTPCSLDRAFVQRSSPVPLEPREHEWMVKAASGDWPSIYSLFRDDNSLLAKRDFISGYTVLHWIAKHGDHRVLNTLWYGVSKVGMTLDVDARTTCGYTPLHMAAMYGHKKLLRILVHKFKADVRVRDTSGRRAWQYLEAGDTPPDLLQMLGAPQGKKRRAMKTKRPCSRDGSPQRQHRDGSSERPLATATNVAATISATVKRHSSLAALFKHKSLARLSGHTEMAV